MFLFSKKSHSRIVHSPGCCYLARTNIKFIDGFYDFEEAEESGYRFCRHCALNDKKGSGLERKLERFCAENGFSFFSSRDHFKISTPSSQWKVFLSQAEGGLILYHKNSFDLLGDVNSLVVGYHRQKNHVQKIQGFFDYIAHHDIYRTANPVAKPKQKQKKKGPKQYTKKYKNAMKIAKKNKRKAAIRRTLQLIDMLEAEHGRSAVFAM